MEKPNLLVVDDEQDSVDALERLFRKSFKVHKATSGKEALKLLKANPASIIISDQRMPEMEGVEFLNKSMDLCPDAIRILLTGYTDIDSVIAAINSGQIYKYITKPWDPHSIVNTVNKAYEKFELREELKRKNQELEKAFAELQTLDQAKSQFMILVNHELKTPLTVISSFLELLLETNLDNEQSKYLNRIQSSTEDLKNIIERVLMLVSARTGQTKVSKDSTDLKSLTDQLSKRFTDLSNKRHISIDLSNVSGKIKTDGKILNVVLSELIENGLSFADQNTTLTLSTNKTKNGTEINICNKGPKLSDEIIETIKKPFALNENAMNHSKGMGLGLSLTQALLELVGSQLDLSYQNGEVSARFEIPS